eukprot:scaffold79845_cov16-Tisochrysis_lutea.AAC.1
MACPGPPMPAEKAAPGNMPGGSMPMAIAMSGPNGMLTPGSGGGGFMAILPPCSMPPRPELPGLLLLAPSPGPTPVPG